MTRIVNVLEVAREVDAPRPWVVIIEPVTVQGDSRGDEDDRGVHADRLYQLVRFFDSGVIVNISTRESTCQTMARSTIPSAVVS